MIETKMIKMDFFKNFTNYQV